MRVSLRFDWSWKNTALAWCRQASSTVRRRRTRTRSSRRTDMNACRGPVVAGQRSRSQREQSSRTSVVSDARSVVTPTCSLQPTTSATTYIPSREHALCDGEQVVLVHALVRHVLLVLADPARVHHLAAARVRLRVQQVVAVRAEVQRRLRPVSARRGRRACAHGPCKRKRRRRGAGHAGPAPLLPPASCQCSTPGTMNKKPRRSTLEMRVSTNATQHKYIQVHSHCLDMREV
jgi:hypothetical protein